MTCRICANATGNQEYCMREMMFGFRDTFTYFQCPACGCLQIAEIPTDMSKYYGGDYYSFDVPTRPVPGDRSWPVRLAIHARDDFAIFRRPLLGGLLYRLFPNKRLKREIEQWFPGDGVRYLRVRRTSRILDVGCGAGGLLLTLHRAGFPHLLGVDAYLAGDIEYPGGLRVLRRTVGEIPGEWDLIIFNHSLEHLSDPREALGLAAKRLAPRGAILVRTPLVDSAAWDQYGINWVQLDAPRHFFVHSLASVKLLASQVGLEVRRVVHDSRGFQFWGSEQYLRDIPLESAHS